MESIAAQCQVIYLDDIWSNRAGIEARVAKLVLPQKDKEETHAQHMQRADDADAKTLLSRDGSVS